jgi:lipoprotein-anchoring transpeptidase ErfK/SrfK
MGAFTKPSSFYGFLFVNRSCVVSLIHPDVEKNRLTRRAACASLFGAAFCALAAPSTQAREMVSLPNPYPPGTIVVQTSARKLFVYTEDGTAIRYNVAVGKPGKQWFGTRVIDGKHIKPAWSPPDEVRRDNPRLPQVIESGDPRNPMGAAALTIAPGQYAVHGTSESMRRSIGSFASYGCIRMLDEDILDLLPHVKVGSMIHVIP